MKKLFFCFIFCFYLLGLYNNCYSQIDKEFWFAVPKETEAAGNLTSQNNVSFKITAYSETAHVTIEMPANSGFTKKTITVAPYSTQIVVLAISWAQFDAIYANTALGNIMPVTSKTNRGIHISSDFDISVYYDYDMNDNRDLWSLKGRNGLDTAFFTPFQNIWRNSNAAPKYTGDLPISSITIVATDSTGPTTVKITPPNIPGAASPIFQGTPNNNPFTITLNRGETYCLVSKGQLGIDHPVGTKITSNKKISVSTNDDAVINPNPTCSGGATEDIMGDELVGTSMIGSKYVVMTGGSNGEYIFVLATQPGTTVNFYDVDGTKIGGTITLNVGQEYRLQVSGIDPQGSIYVNASSNVYVWHVTSLNCQFAAAQLPPITNCTGSKEVSFFVANTINSFTVNLMVPRLSDLTVPITAATQPINFFWMKGTDGTNIQIPGSWFELNDSSNWFVLKPAYRNFTGITKAGFTYTITNTADFFHFGYTNGHDQKANKYGYFSSFNVMHASAYENSTETPNKVACFGDTVVLRANGGMEYSWHYGTPTGPPTYISMPTSAITRVYPPPGVHVFYVNVSNSRCFSTATLPVIVTILPRAVADFQTDKVVGCAPLSIDVTNTSIGANRFYWSYIENGTEYHFVPPSQSNFTVNIDNNLPPYLPLYRIYKLIVSQDGACPDSTKREIVTYPEINAGFLPNDTIGCSPLLVNFRNLSSGNITDSSFYWNFGDQNTSVIKVPSHLYSNYLTVKDTTYNVQMVATSPYLCRDTARGFVTVHPYIKAGFTVDTVRGCSPFFIKLYNNSQNRKAISRYFWDFNSGNSAAPRDTLTTGDVDTLFHAFPRNLTNAPIDYRILLTVSHNLGSGCPDTISRLVTVYPEGKVNILNPDTVGCNALTIKFRVQADAGVTQYVWNFGDGGTSIDSLPTHQFVNLTNTNTVYKVAVRTSSAQYCAGYDTMLVTVYAKLNPMFAIDVPVTCAPYNATFTNKSTGGITSYQWSFGDGSVDTTRALSFTHYYRNNSTTPATYNAKLVVLNNGGCKDSVSQNITLYPEVHAQFTYAAGSFCSPRKVDFVNQSNSAASKFIWKFGDNTSSLAYDTTHYYYNNTSAEINYNAYLIAISDYNCKDSTAFSPFLVYPYIEPYFALDTTAGCSPLTVKISNGSLGPYTYESWDFNDGQPASLAQPKIFSHTFQNTYLNRNQSFLITLKINYKGLCQKTYYKPVTVYPPVLPMVSVNLTTICNNSEITFKDSSNRSSVPYSYQWNFGDGASAVGVYGANRSFPIYTKHLYENVMPIYKTFQAVFSAYSQLGCKKDTNFSIIVFPEVNASFSVNNAAACSPFVAAFRDGSTSTATWKRFWDDEKSPSAGFPYTYLPASQTYKNEVDSVTKVFRPKLKVAYLYNNTPVCADSITQSVQVFPKVTAYFSAKDSFKVCNPDSVHFANGSRIGLYNLLAGDNRLAYQWTFGDNGSSGDYEPSHVYHNYSFDKALTDTVWLRVNSVYGCGDSLKKIVTIYPKPKAFFSIENPIACPPFKVQIDNSSVAETGSLFTWKFNDGGSDTTTRAPVETIYHSFSNTGGGILSYPINLTVLTPYNCTSSKSQNIDVYPQVIADFDKDTAGCTPFTVTFKDKSQQADSWDWTFGDGYDSKIQSPTHTFLNNSVKDTVFTVTVRAESKYGCYHDTTHRVTVYPQPEANFDASPSYFTYSPTSNIVTFTNYSNAGNWKYLWNYDDLLPKDTSRGPILKHDYQHWGYYNVKLNVWSNHCSDSVYHHITIVAPKPIADFNTSENGCVPWTVTFTNMSQYGTSWRWEFGDGETYNGQNPPPHEYTTAGTFNVKLTVSGDGGTSYAFKDVVVYPKPKVDFNFNPKRVNIDNIRDKDGNLVWGAKVDFYNTSELGEQFLWDFGDSTKSNERVPSHIYKNVGRYTVKLGAWTNHQCYDEKILKDTVLIIGVHDCVFPNAFTPVYGINDGTYSFPDLKNEVFHPTWSGIVEYHLEIYDRWGEKLFVSDNVNVGWNGYYKGKLCKTDVYIWRAKGKFTDGSLFDKAGNVTLLR